MGGHRPAVQITRRQDRARSRPEGRPACRHRSTDLGRSRAHRREASDHRGGQAMMRLARRATLLVAFSLLISAATAFAECAWVLWEQINTQPWSMKDGFPDTDSCQRALRSGVRKSVSRYPGSEDSAVIKKASGRFTLTFACLPDTVDPRGPKGK